MTPPPFHLFILAMLAGLAGQALEFTSFQFCYLIAVYAAGLLVVARPVALLALLLWAAGWGAPAATVVLAARCLRQKSLLSGGYFASSRRSLETS